MNPLVEQLVGRTLGGRYRLARAIGAGGMGAVFEAVQIDLGRTVAVKVLLDVDPRGVARLRQEALTAGSLSCPHVVSIFDFQAPPNEPPFIVMELLPGRSLAQLLAQERMLAVPRAARIACQMLIGLEAAHHAGVIHRDVKPSNTWLVFGAGIDEHVKMLDFGIAKLLGDGASSLLTSTGSVMGTPAYLAPEQLRDAPVDARADIHAMGVVLFEMLTGSRLWSSTGPAIYAEILERQPPLVHQLAPAVPPALSHIVARALAKDPAARFQRASDLRAALEPFASASAASPATVVAGHYGATGTHATGPSSQLAAATGYVAPTGSMYPSSMHPPSMSPPMSPAYAAVTFNDTRSSTHPSGPFPPHASYAPPPPSAAASPSYAMPFLLGGGVVLLAGGALAVAFLLGRDRFAPAPTAATAAPVTVDAGAGAPLATADAGARPASAAAPAARGAPAGARAGSAGATPAAAGAAGAAAPAAAGAAGAAASAKCECETRLGATVCTGPKIPNCRCHPSDDFTASLCPQPFGADGSCAVRGANGILPYSAVGRKDDQACSGFRHLGGGKSAPATGTTDCQFCYGHDKFAGVEGTVCKGLIGIGETVEGKVVCEH